MLVGRNGSFVDIASIMRRRCEQGSRGGRGALAEGGGSVRGSARRHRDAYADFSQERGLGALKETLASRRKCRGLARRGSLRRDPWSFFWPPTDVSSKKKAVA